MNYNERPVLTDSAATVLSQINTETSNNFFALATLISAQELPNVFREIDFIIEDDKVMASYISEKTTNNGTTEVRQCMKVGKILKYLTEVFENSGAYEIYELREEEKFTDAKIEDLVHKIQSALLQENLVFEIVSGADIPKYYKVTNYISGVSSTLGSSCMRYEKINHLMNFYANIPQCHMVILKDTLIDSNKIVARALLWEAASGMYMDRRYYHNETYDQALVQFAKKKGFFYKTQNTADSSASTDFIAPSGKRVQKQLIFALPKQVVSNLPYADSLFEYYPELGLISNREINLKYSANRIHIRNQSETNGKYYPLLDLVGENMLGFTCSNCGKHVKSLESFVQGDGFICDNCK